MKANMAWLKMVGYLGQEKCLLENRKNSAGMWKWDVINLAGPMGIVTIKLLNNFGC